VIMGPCGSGKSTLAQHVFRHIEGAFSVKALVNCSIYRTAFSIFKEVIPSSRLVFSRTRARKTKRSIRQSNKHSARRLWGISRLYCWEDFAEIWGVAERNPLKPSLERITIKLSRALPLLCTLKLCFHCALQPCTRADLFILQGTGMIICKPSSPTYVSPE
jgi:hypothetical protein